MYPLKENFCSGPNAAAKRPFLPKWIFPSFVPFDNPDNFEKYNRVKTIKAYDENNNLIGTFNLKDDCSIQTFSLDAKVSFVRFEIAELYEGTLFSDVAITLLQMLK